MPSPCTGIRVVRALVSQVYLEACIVSAVVPLSWLTLACPVPRPRRRPARGAAHPAAALVRQRVQHQQRHQPLQRGQQRRLRLQEEEEEELGECVCCGGCLRCL